MTEGMIWALVVLLLVEGIFAPIRYIILAFRTPNVLADQEPGEPDTSTDTEIAQKKEL